MTRVVRIAPDPKPVERFEFNYKADTRKMAQPRLNRTTKEVTKQPSQRTRRLFSDEDLDFFMFFTPYLVPPRMMTELLDETEGD